MSSMSNPWQDAVISQLDCLHLTSSELEADPVKAVNALLCWSQRIALDPAVSSEAEALIERGRREAVKRGQAATASLRRVLQHHSVTLHGDGVLEADIFAALGLERE